MRRPYTGETTNKLSDLAPWLTEFKCGATGSLNCSRSTIFRFSTVTTSYGSSCEQSTTTACIGRSLANKSKRFETTKRALDRGLIGADVPSAHSRNCRTPLGLRSAPVATGQTLVVITSLRDGFLPARRRQRDSLPVLVFWRQ